MLVAKFKKIPKSELPIVIMLIATFALAFVITSTWGDNEINSLMGGNLQGHSLWHLLTAIVTIIAGIWVNERTANQTRQAEIDSAVKKAIEEYKAAESTPCD